MTRSSPGTCPIIRLIRGFRRSLRRDSDASNQDGEALIGTQRVPERFQFEIGKTSEAFVVPLFELRERLILVLQLDFQFTTVTVQEQTM
jgi:hypothetical protein